MSLADLRLVGAGSRARPAIPRPALARYARALAAAREAAQDGPSAGAVRLGAVAAAVLTREAARRARAALPPDVARLLGRGPGAA